MRPLNITLIFLFLFTQMQWSFASTAFTAPITMGHIEQSQNSEQTENTACMHHSSNGDMHMVKASHHSDTRLHELENTNSKVLTHDCCDSQEPMNSSCSACGEDCSCGAMCHFISHSVYIENPQVLSFSPVISNFNPLTTSALAEGALVREYHPPKFA